MAGAKDIRAGRAFVELGVQDQLAVGLNKASKRLKAFGAGVRAAGVGLMGVGSAAIAPLLGASKIFADMGSKIYDASQRTGVAVEALSALAYAAGQAGADLETLEGGLKKMQRAITEAAGGSKSAQEALAKLGMTAGELKGLAPDKQFEALAKRIAALKDPTERAAIAMELFGKSGVQLVPLMGEMDALTKRARALGLVMSTEDARAADTFGDTLGDLWAQLKAVAFQGGAAIAGFLQPFAEQATAVLAKVINWTKQNRALIVTVFKLAAGVAAAGAGLVVMGAAFTTLGAVVGALPAVLAGIAAGFGLMMARSAGVVDALKDLSRYLLHSTTAGKAMVEWFTSAFNTLKTDALAAFGGIRDALAGGDWQAAARVGMALVKLEFTRGANAIEGVWLKLKFSVIRGMQEMWTGVLAAQEMGIHSATTMLLKGAAAWDKLWARAKGAREESIIETTTDMADLLLLMEKISNPKFDLQRARADLEANRIKQVNENKAGTGGELAGIDADLKAALEGAQNQHADNLQKIAEQEIDAKARLTEAHKAASDAAQKELDAARAALDIAVGKARSTSASTPGRLPPIPKAQDIGDALQSAVTRFSSAGTYNPFGAGQLAGPMNQIAAATKASARSLKNLERRAGAGAPTFK